MVAKLGVLAINTCEQYFVFSSLLLLAICPVATAQVPSEHHPNGQTSRSDLAAHPISYQLNRQKLIERIEVLAKEGAGIAAYKAALEAIDKKSANGIDEKQLTVELEKLAQEVSEQEQTRGHIKEEEAHPQTQVPAERGNGYASERWPSQEDLARAQDKLKEGEAEAQRIRDRAEEQIRSIQAEEHTATYYITRRGLGEAPLPADQANEAKAPYERQIKEIREHSEGQANEVLLEYKRQAEAINPAFRAGQ